VFNLWVEYPFLHIEPKDTPEIKVKADFILEHLNIICGRGVEQFEYVKKWIAQSIQYPHIKTSFLGFSSEEGAGKDSLLEVYGRMVGQKRVKTTTRPEDIFGKFNTALVNCSMVCLAEMSASDTMKYDKDLKALITDPRISIEPKGGRVFTMKSHHRVVLFTNKTSFPVQTSKSDRRKLLIRSSDEKIGNREYFSELHSYIEDDDVICYLFHYFNTMDVESFNKTKGADIPKTDYQKTITENFHDPVESFINTIAYRTNDEEPIAMYDGVQLLQSYKDYSVMSGNKLELTIQALGVRIKLLNIQGVSKEHKERGVVYSFDKSQIKNHFRGPMM
jgi:phage/plasmid-associated DNA primase